MAESESCSSCSGLKLPIKQIGAGLGLLLLRVLILSLALSYLMSLIDGLRTAGEAPLALPFSALGQYQPRLDNAVSAPWYVLSFDKFLFWYNCAFPGASRLGCGIGIILASFWTLHTTPAERRLQRAVTGIVAGALIGFRLTLMVTSSALVVLSMTVIFALGLTVYMLCADSRPGIPPLPLVARENPL